MFYWRTIDGGRLAESDLGGNWTAVYGIVPGEIAYAKFGDPQTLNLYAYVENEPLNRVDADGHNLINPTFSAAAEAEYVEGVNGAWQATHPQPAMVKQYTIQVLGSDGKRHKLALPVGSQVLMMTRTPIMDTFTAAAAMDVDYRVYNVGAKGLSPETKPTEVLMKEDTTAGSNCSKGCSNKVRDEYYQHAHFPDYDTASGGPSFESTQHYFIGDMKNPPAQVLSAIVPGVYDAGKAVHVRASYGTVSVKLEP
jgi:hypothetical protein